MFTIDQERLRRQRVARRGRSKRPANRERGYRDRCGRERARRRELNPLAAHCRINCDRLKLPIAAAADQSQATYRHEEKDERAVPVHGDSPLQILTYTPAQAELGRGTLVSPKTLMSSLPTSSFLAERPDGHAL